MSEAENYDDWAADGPEPETPQDAEQPEEQVEGESPETPEPAEEPSPEGTDAPEEEDDTISRSDFDELKGRYADLEHRYKSDEGRVNAMRKQISDLEAQLAETRQKIPDEPVEPDTDDWKEFKELYPKAAEQLAEQMRRERLPQPPGDPATQPDRAPWDAVMDAARPGWRDAVNTAEFTDWLGTQSPEWQQLAHTPDGFAALQVYDRYKGHLDESRRKADALKARRQQRLESAESVGGAHSKPPPDNDPLSGWAAD